MYEAGNEGQAKADRSSENERGKDSINIQTTKNVNSHCVLVLLLGSQVLNSEQYEGFCWSSIKSCIYHASSIVYIIDVYYTPLTGIILPCIVIIVIISFVCIYYACGHVQYSSEAT